MAVPKMAKNGQNSRLHASAGFDKDSAQRNQEQIRSPKPSLDHEGRIKTVLHQFQNKNARHRFFIDLQLETKHGYSWHLLDSISIGYRQGSLV
jgi:hypothetical protein